jgi:hypothetical protein
MLGSDTVMPVAGDVRADGSRRERPDGDGEAAGRGASVKQYPFYLAGRAHSPNSSLEVTDKYTGEVAYRVARAGPEEIDR